MSLVSDIGIPGLGGAGILQPKQKFKWRVTFANLGGGIDSQPVSVSAVTVTRPSISHEEVQLDRYNSKIWIAGKHSFEPIQLSILDSVDGRASQVIQAQIQTQQLLIGAQGQYLATAGEASSYKFSMAIEMLDGADTPIERWSLSGAWIKEANFDDLDYSSSDVVKINLTIRFDIAVQDLSLGAARFGNTGGLATGGQSAP